MTRDEAEKKLLGIFTATDAGLGSPLGFIAALEQLGLLKLDEPVVRERRLENARKIWAQKGGSWEDCLLLVGLKIVEA